MSDDKEHIAMNKLFQLIEQIQIESEQKAETVAKYNEVIRALQKSAKKLTRKIRNKDFDLSDMGNI
jgi:hypothetical protein